jgi:hypothetical protein
MLFTIKPEPQTNSKTPNKDTPWTCLGEEAFLSQTKNGPMSPPLRLPLKNSIRRPSLDLLPNPKKAKSSKPLTLLPPQRLLIIPHESLSGRGFFCFFPPQKPLIFPYENSSGRGFSCLSNQTTPSTLAALDSF